MPWCGPYTPGLLLLHFAVRAPFPVPIPVPFPSLPFPFVLWRCHVQAEDLTSQQDQLAAGAVALEALAAEVESLAGVVAGIKARYESAAGELEAKRARARECDREMASLVKQKDKAARKLADNQVEARKLEHKLARAQREAQESAARLKQLQEACPWIAQERQLFGRPGGDYDFASRSPEEANRALAAANEAQSKLGKTINKKVVSMFDKAEQEYKELMQKRGIVLNDKAKIEQVIAELDEKKKEALLTTWTKVNKDFGSIFSTLLAGTSAKLEVPEGASSFLDGLEVRVAFGGVWKQSLTELSGGQRSLLALSLILALLLFKPAPIYILDEVDAALDLSHTQNIGRMIRTHFPYSQFIVVSLKEGMFNNANVIFRTKFVDGTSCVTRTVPALKDKDVSGGIGLAEDAKR